MGPTTAPATQALLELPDDGWGDEVGDVAPDDPAVLDEEVAVVLLLGDVVMLAELLVGVLPVEADVLVLVADVEVTGTVSRYAWIANQYWAQKMLEVTSAWAPGADMMDMVWHTAEP